MCRCTKRWLGLAQGECGFRLGFTCIWLNRLFVNVFSHWVLWNHVCAHPEGMVRFVALTCVQDVMGHTSLLVNYSFSNGFGDKPQYIKWVIISFAVAILAQGFRSPGVECRIIWNVVSLVRSSEKPKGQQCLWARCFGISSRIAPNSSQDQNPKNHSDAPWVWKM